MSIKIEVTEITNEMLVQSFNEMLEKVDFLSSELDANMKVLLIAFLNNVLNCHYENIVETVNKAVILHLEEQSVNFNFEENE